jgi:hypothetical protein
MRHTLRVGSYGCDFTTIASAILYAQGYCSKTNRVTIYIEAGIYNEEITLLDNPGIDIIGSGINSTIVQFASTYPHSPIYTTGDGLFENIKFVALGTLTSYAFHYEINDGSVTGTTIFRNCRFESGSSAAVGAGLGANCKLVLDGCQMQANGAVSLYFHNNPYSDRLNQFLEVKNCEFLSHVDGRFVTVDDACAIYGHTNSQLYVTFKNNTSKFSGKINFRKLQNQVFGYVPLNDSNIHIMADSIGNNLPGLTFGKADITYSFCTVKPVSTVYGTNYYIYTIPFENADKYDWEIVSVSIVGLVYITQNCSVNGVGNGFIEIKDTNNAGAGYSIQVVVKGTAI